MTAVNHETDTHLKSVAFEFHHIKRIDFTGDTRFFRMSSILLITNLKNERILIALLGN